MAQAEALGYCTFAARGSRGVVDVLCFESHHDERAGRLVPLAVQCGTANKPIAATLAELIAAPRPIGSLCIVARKCKQKNGRIKWRFHTQDGTFANLQAAIEGRAR